MSTLEFRGLAHSMQGKLFKQNTSFSFMYYITPSTEGE